MAASPSDPALLDATRQLGQTIAQEAWTRAPERDGATRTGIWTPKCAIPIQPQRRRSCEAMSCGRAHWPPPPPISLPLMPLATQWAWGPSHEMGRIHLVSCSPHRGERRRRHHPGTSCTQTGNPAWDSSRRGAGRDPPRAFRHLITRSIPGVRAIKLQNGIARGVTNGRSSRPADHSGFAARLT